MKINSKIWLWVISILLAANLVLIGFLYLGSTPPQKGKRLFLEDQLNFDKSQTAQLKLLTDQLDHKIRKVSDSIRINKDEFFKGLREEKNVQEQEVFAQRIGELETSREKLTYEHFQSIREICNDEQKKDFDKLIREIMHPRGQGGPPPKDGSNERGEGPEDREHRPPPPGGMGPEGDFPPPPPKN